MIPESRTPDIMEFMTGFTVRNYTSSSSNMDVFIPMIMLDKSPSIVPNNISTNSNLFVSRENIRPSPIITDLNYITIKVSDLMQLTYRIPKEFPSGSKVRIYVPELNLDDALIIPFV